MNCGHFNTKLPYRTAVGNKLISHCNCDEDCVCNKDDGVCVPPVMRPVEPHGGARLNKGKLPLELISPYATEGLAKVLLHGAAKYAPRNWEKGLSWMETIGSLKRHILALEKGIDIDDGPDGSGLPNVDGIQVNAMFLSHFFHTKTGTDDRVKQQRGDAEYCIHEKRISDPCAVCHRVSYVREQTAVNPHPEFSAPDKSMWPSAETYQRAMLLRRERSDMRGPDVVHEEALDQDLRFTNAKRRDLEPE